MKRLGLLFLMSYALSAGMAHAATYYVSKAGGSNTCAQAQSTSSPMLTIAAGLRCLAAGDTLLVRAGTYDEAIVDSAPSGTSWANKVRIAAYTGETVWLAPSSGDNAIYFSGTEHYIEFDGINLRGPAPGAVVFLGDAVNHIRIQNAESVNDNSSGWSGSFLTPGSDNEFINLAVHGVGGPYAFYIGGDRNLVDRCDMYNLSMAGVHIYNSGGNPTGNIVRNSRIHDLTSSSFFGAADPRMWGILVSGTSNQIYNNIIYNINFPYQSSNAGVYVYTGSGHKIWNNTIYKNTTDGIYLNSGVSSIEVKNNIVYANAGSNFVAGAGNVESNNLWGVDPLFVNPSGSNFQLQSASRAIDAGASLSVVMTDIAGIARPQGSAPDIGAYEYHAQEASPPPPPPPTGLRILSD